MPQKITDKQRVSFAGFCFGLMLVVQLIGAFSSHSLGLLADAFHTSADLVALALAGLALSWQKRPATKEYSFGLGRIESIVGGINGILLVVFVLFASWKSLERLIAPSVAIHGSSMFSAAALSLVLNAIALCVISPISKSNLAIRGADLHIKNDLFVGGGVLAGSIAIWATGWRFIDPMIAMIIAGTIGFHTFELLRDSFDNLMDRTPKHIDPEEVKQAIRSIPLVESIHHLHIWEGATGLHLEAHITLTENMRLSETLAVEKTIKQKIVATCGDTHIFIEFKPPPPLVQLASPST
ncbi:MAG TPA: cation diffusion facilitator family transporter [Patescibacteria group bacterium]|nr:cation diffusion facilitator family transporter [Patescibacteria group bacterium]